MYILQYSESKSVLSFVRLYVIWNSLLRQIWSQRPDILHTLPKIRHTVCQLSGAYPPAFKCIAPVYTWHTGIDVLMVQILS